MPPRPLASPDPPPSRPPPRPRPRPRPRGEQRESQIRAELEPLDPGERPGPIVVAVAVSSVLGLANLAGYLAGAKIGGRAPGPGVLSFSAVMGIAAVAMWQLRYWAVLAFEALLGLIVVAFSLFLVRAANVEALVVCVAIIASAGWLFYRLVRVLARIQTPPR